MRYAAVKCYLKAGFQDTGETIWDDGDECMLLRIRFDENSILYDSHLHTTMSVDSDLEVTDAIRIAKENNIGIVITDHMDWDFPIPYPDFRVDLEQFFKEYSPLRSNTVLLGIELGMTENSIEKNRSIIKEYDFDFVLGSIHVLYGKEVDEDLFREMDETDVFRDYLVTCNQLVKKLHIDSFAHIDYPLRSTSKELRYEDYKTEFDIFFETLVNQKICLELNTSRLSESEEVRNNMLAIYRAYKAKGGKYVTIGSDAHEPEEVGDNFHMAKEFLRQSDLLPVHFVNRKMIVDKL